MTEVAENFIGETSFSKLFYKDQFYSRSVFDSMVGKEQKDILCCPFRVSG